VTVTVSVTTVLPSGFCSRIKTYSTAITCLHGACRNSKSGHVQRGDSGSGFTLYSPWPGLLGTRVSRCRRGFLALSEQTTCWRRCATVRSLTFRSRRIQYRNQAMSRSHNSGRACITFTPCIVRVSTALPQAVERRNHVSHDQVKVWAETSKQDTHGASKRSAL
jgi:hypothetical protein